MKDHSDIIGLWPTIIAFAEDIGIEYPTAKQMNRRKRIGPAHWSKVEAAANVRGLEGEGGETINVALLVNLYSQAPSQDAAE